MHYLSTIRSDIFRLLVHNVDDRLFNKHHHPIANGILRNSLSPQKKSGHSSLRCESALEYMSSYVVSTVKYPMSWLIL